MIEAPMFSRYLAGIGAGTALALALLVTPLAFADDAKTVEFEVRDIKLKVPETWKKKDVTGFRAAQFDIPAAEGDKEGGELIVFHFGPNGGGGVQANIDRWTKQFDAEQRKLKILDGESSQGKYTLVELSGTWNKSIGPPIAMKTVKMPGARFLGVILHSEKGGDFFVRFTGPDKTVTANAKAFRASFGADAEKEKERKEDKPAEEKKE
jgi:hypothetical protein